jgi:ABC-type amino acid transport system permease subunit
MDSRTKVFRAHRAFAALYAVIGIGILALMIVNGKGGLDLSLLPVLVVMAIVFSAHLFTARACKQGKPGGRIASIVIACLMLLGFPVGTIVGVYLLFNTRKPWPSPESGTQA